MPRGAAALSWAGALLRGARTSRRSLASSVDLTRARAHDHAALREELLVFDQLLTRAEAQTLADDVAAVMDELPMREEHFDGLIARHREFHTGVDAPMWTPRSRAAVARVRTTVAELHFPALQPQLHVLELPNGAAILPHFDSVKFSGSITVGINLNAPAVLRFTDGGSVAELHIDPGSVYIMSGLARYVYKHEVLPIRGLRRFALIQRDPGPCSHLPVWLQYLHGIFPLPPTSDELLAEYRKKRHDDFMRTKESE
ncbi:hypothetical protein AB1Y20_019454 [Prymnesium parvum]|uniref:Fe2OG dioxygenase domain-containing protein n=1 Tax=Prymnesium parvum TaxID=97485 RepID=A0AB34JR76_PRYPA